MPLPLVLYGATNCEDTWHVRQRLRESGIPFREINIDHDADGERFVVFINCGYRSTPTLVFGEGKFRIIVTEPTDHELEQALSQAGYAISAFCVSGGAAMTATSIPGYTYGTDQVSHTDFR